MLKIKEKNTDIRTVLSRNSANAFGEKIGLLGKLFGCRHKDLTRPFTVKKSSYCACLECGARQPFDAENLRAFGSFYYPPTNSFNKN